MFRADGTMVATSTTQTGYGLWTDGLLAPIDEDLTGAIHPAYTWTGTDGYGYGYNPLGASPYVASGNTGSVQSDWINGGTLPAADSLSMFGISQVLTVEASSVPEPSSLVLLGAASLVTLAGREVLRRWRQMRQRRRALTVL